MPDSALGCDPVLGNSTQVSRVYPQLVADVLEEVSSVLNHIAIRNMVAIVEPVHNVAS
jgi:hypothetical protein